MLKNKILEGKVALITGGTRGIGKAMAETFVAEGCYVICTGTKPSASKHPQMECWPVDLSDEKSVNTFLLRLSGLKQLDIVVNNAGMNKIASIDQIDMNDWEKILKVNLTGVMSITKAASQIMIKKKIQGRILNVSSIFGIVSRAKRNSYSASKAGVIGLTRSSALDLAPYKILVNALCPGFVLTDLTKSILSKKDISALEREVPLRRFGNESEMAKTAVFLCSDLNTYITGQAIVVDGGYTAK